MSNPAKAKGTAFESLIRDYLRGVGLAVERVPAGMAADRGDLNGIPGWTFELKCYPQDIKRAISDGLADLEVEQANADTPYGAVIAKRRGHTAPGEQLVVMELHQFVAALLLRVPVSAEPGGE